MSACPLCGAENAFSQLGNGGAATFYMCDTCGSFALTTTAQWTVRNPNYDLAIISAYTRERTESSEPPVTIFSEEPKQEYPDSWATFERIKSWFPTSVPAKLDIVLRLLAKRSRFPGDRVTVTETDYPLFYVESREHRIEIMTFMLQTLIDGGYISGRTTFPGQYYLTEQGWNRILDNSRQSDSNQAFIAMWFDDSMASVSENGFKRAITDAGYHPIRIDDKQHNGKIDDEIIAEIRRSRFVVCDFTGERGGVYFEAGFAMGMGLPVIWTCRQDHINSVHFDTRQYNHIIWTDENDLYQKLLNRIRATIA